MRKEKILEEAAFLTDKDKTVISLVASGYTSKDIASELFVSHRTVENDLYRLCRIFHCSNKTQLACMLLSVGVIEYKEKAPNPTSKVSKIEQENF